MHASPNKTPALPTVVPSRSNSYCCLPVVASDGWIGNRRRSMSNDDVADNWEDVEESVCILLHIVLMHNKFNQFIFGLTA